VTKISVLGNDVCVGGQFTTAYNGTLPLIASNVALATWNEHAQNWIWSALDAGMSSLAESSFSSTQGD